MQNKQARAPYSHPKATKAPVDREKLNRFLSDLDRYVQWKSAKENDLDEPSRDEVIDLFFDDQQ
jgi:hypothetical protein